MGLRIGDLSAGKREEEEEEGAGKLAGHGDEMISYRVGPGEAVSMHAWQQPTAGANLQEPNKWHSVFLRGKSLGSHAGKDEPTSQVSRRESIHGWRCR